MKKATQYAELLDPRTLLSKIRYLLRARLWLQLLVGMGLGVGLGLLLSPSGMGLLDTETAATVAEWVAIPGGIFLGLIQMVVIPLVMTSIVLGLTSVEDKSFLAKVGLRIAPYFVMTTGIAVAFGTFLALLIKPGAYIDPSLIAKLDVSGTTTVPAAEKLLTQSIPQQLIGLLPRNPLEAQLNGAMLQMVILAIIGGVVLLTMPEKQARPLLALSESVQQASMKIVGWAMAIAPVAVFGMLCDITIRTGFDALFGVGVYMGTVVLGLLSLVVFYMLIVAVLGRRNPFWFLKAIRECQLLAFSTSSSAAVMPLSMKTAETELGVERPIAHFIIPLGATVNMDGTAIYQVIATIFLAQVYDVHLSAMALVMIMFTTIGASIGTPSTPGIGIVVLATILMGAGIPPSGIALIIGVDRILDMSRTTINVTGDLAACVVMNRWLAGKIETKDDGLDEGGAVLS